MFAEATCDVAAVVEWPWDAGGGPIVVPFGAFEHDWAALELGAWAATVLDRPLHLIGAADERSGDRDASRLLADALLIVQHTTGVVAEPLLGSSPGSKLGLGSARYGGRTVAVAVGAGAVWAPSDEGSVIRIDPATGDTERIDVGGAPTGIAVGAGLIWVRSASLTLQRTRADHHRVRAFALALTLFSSVLAAGCTRSEQAAAPVDTAACSDVIYEGEGKPDAIIVSDLLRGEPRHGVRVIEGVLRQRGFRAGEYRIGYQACNSEVGERPCERNAKAYAAARDVLGMIGPYYSACAALQIPILSRTATGPLAMVSPTNTDPGLTRRTPFSDNEPGSLYSGGVRNYARVVASDDDVGAAAATLAKQMGVGRVVALVNREPIGFKWYGRSVGGAFVETARSLGLVTTELEWRNQRSYAAIARRAAAARPQLVFLAGHTQNNAGRLMEDLRRELGTRVVFAAGDQFLAAPSLPNEWGPIGEGLRVTGYGVPPEGLSPAARGFLRSVGAPEDEPYLVEAAQAAGVLLDAIARSDGTRAVVVEELFNTRVTGGILGSFSFDQYGDITPAVVALRSVRNGAVVVDGVVRVPSRPDN